MSNFIRRSGGVIKPASFSFWAAWVVMAGLSSGGAEPGQQNGAVPVPAGLVSWWRGEGDPNDTQGEAKGVAYRDLRYVAGKVGKCFSFSGRGGGINVPDVPSLALTRSLAIEVWLFVPSNPLVPGMVLFRGDIRSGYDAYYLSVEPTPEHPAMLIFVVTGPDNSSSSVKAPMPIGSWTHVAATLEDCTGQMRLYTNAVLAAEAKTNVRPLANLDAAFRPGIGIGNHSSQPGPFNYPFNGLIDELSVYNRALSIREIEAIHAAGSAGKIQSAPKQ